MASQESGGNARQAGRIGIMDHTNSIIAASYDVQMAIRRYLELQYSRNVIDRAIPPVPAYQDARERTEGVITILMGDEAMRLQLQAANAQDFGRHS